MESELNNVLNEFRQIKGVEVAVVATRDGVNIASTSAAGVDLYAISAMTAVILGAAEMMYSQALDDRAEHVSVECEHGTVFITGICSKAVLGVTTANSMVLGQVIYEIKQLAEKLAPVMPEKFKIG
ncbi:MAG TPA: hypothetical protein HA257_00725 [Candidatus Methanoperedenaceae archaeon]|nr:hypothetical protein [Candidatus Methanoperedenaceae archaeon]